MVVKKFLLAVFVFNVINFCYEDMHTSTVYAQIQTCVGIDTAMLDFGEDDPEIVKTVKNVAKMRAIQAVKEKAGIVVRSYTKTLAGKIAEDDIDVYASTNIEIVKVTYKKLPYEVHNFEGNTIGKIGFMYEAEVIANIDTSGLADYINLDYGEKSALIQQNKFSMKNVEEINQDFDNLHSSSKDVLHIKNECDRINSEVLIQQKLEEGDKFITQQNYEESIARYKEVIRMDKDNSEAYARLGLVYNCLKNYNEAVENTDKAIQLNPHSIVGYFCRSLAYSGLKKYENAFEDSNNIIRLTPGEPIGYFSRAIVYSRLEDYSKAVTDFAEAIQLGMKSGEIYYLRGCTYMETKNYSKAIEDFNEAMLINPTLKDVYGQRGRTFLESGNYKKAIADLDRALEYSPSDISWYGLRGFCYDALGNYEKAVSDYTRAIEIYPLSDFYKFRATDYMRLKKFEQAVVDFTKYISLCPSDAEGYFYRAICYFALEKFNNSIEDCTQAIQMQPNQDVIAKIYYLRARSYGKIGKTKKCMEDMANASNYGYQIYANNN